MDDAGERADDVGEKMETAALLYTQNPEVSKKG
jgi:hypothetical protein